MSTQFTNDAIETLGDWNAVLGNGCCCQMPACPTPIRICQSIQRGTESEHGVDWKYDQLLAAYNAAMASHEAWETARDEWVAEEAGRDPDDYPEPEPEVPDEPTKPAGYDDWQHGTWIQFSEPAIALDEDLPFLYRRHKYGPWMQGVVELPGEGVPYFTGTHGLLEALDDINTSGPSPYVQASQFGHLAQTFSGGAADSSDGTWTFGSAAYTSAGVAVSCDITTMDSDGSPPPGYGDGSEIPPDYPGGEWPVTTPGSWNCTPTTQTYTGETRELEYGTETGPLSCPGPWGSGPTPPSVWVDSSWAELTAKYPDRTNTFSDAISKDGLRSEAVADMPAWPEDPNDAEDDECAARYSSNWPVKEDGMIPAIPPVEADPEADPPVEAVDGVPAHWPACDDPIHPNPYNATVTVRKVRYRWGVPSQIIYRQDPDVPVDPEAPPMPDDGFPDPPPDEDLDPDPVDWWKGTYFKITWDILTEPFGWDDTINDPEATPPDPLPEGVTLDEWWDDHQVPRTGRPLRTLEEDLVWEWAGPGDPEDPESWLSGWYALDPPAVPGEKRVVNVRFQCYHGPYGTKPQVIGEAVTLPDS